MATASGEAPARRRRGRGRKEPSTPAEIGTGLVRARQALGLGLVDVRDRTGVPLPILEALESGEITRVPNQDAARIGLRRYAELVGLDGKALVQALDHWLPTPTPAHLGGPGPSPAGPAGGSVPGVPVGATGGPPPTGGFAGHLRRYPGDGAHLQAFTQTAQ
ncbi:MAG TPA: helix-turn-helix transcriptional regulator, partial [Acidimicrobiales bacterium]|nr:helix-turn-helix transcriptional regulator [Acidimicrobiales bacterium]